MKYRKKPVVIEAFQMTKESRWDNSEWPTWLHEAWQKGAMEGGMYPDPDAPPNPAHESADELCIGTLEGVHRVTFGDFIIQGVQGELYPCKPDIFEATYEEVDDSNEGSDSIEPEGRVAFDFGSGGGHHA